MRRSLVRLAVIILGVVLIVCMFYGHRVQSIQRLFEHVKDRADEIKKNVSQP